MIRVRQLAIVALVACFVPAAASAGVQEAQVYAQGQYGYHTFRIPAVIISNDGTVLAFAEGRVNSPWDSGNIDLVLRRSFDGGQVWQGLQVVHDDGAQTIGNPVPVVDRTTGTIWLLFCRNNAAVFVTHSTDDGQTWSVPTNITNDAADPSWDWVATGPVHGFQMTDGRLMVPSYRNPSGSASDVRSYMIISDDHGATWTKGSALSTRTSEPTAVETEDGRVYINTRSWSGMNQRASAFSSNGGVSWGPVTYEPSLPDQPCQGSVIRYTTKFDDGLNRLLFSNPPRLTRHQLSVRVSYDEGLTWTPGRMVYPEDTGYSDLTILPDGDVGVLYERGASVYYESIWFATFDRDWVEHVTDHVLWNFDEQSSGTASSATGAIEDLGGTDRHATAVGSRLPSYVPGAPEYGGSPALTFGIGSDAVEWPDDGERALDFEAADSFTLEVIMRTSAHTSGGSGGAGGLISKDWAAGQPSWWLRVENAMPRFLIEDDAGNVVGVSGSVTVADGQWHHVAAVRDAEYQELRVYVDHVQVGVATDTTTGTLANDQDIRVGAFSNASREFDGDIDLVRISRGALLVDAFVQPVTGSPVAAWWTFEEQAAGTTASTLIGALRDASGSRQPATADGAVPPTYVTGCADYGQTTALQLTTSDDQIVIADRGTDMLDFAGDESFTLEALIRTTHQDAGGIIAKEEGINQPSWRCQIEDGGRLQFHVCDGPRTSTVLSDAGDSISDGAWHHVAAVRDTAGSELRLYVDRVLVKSATDQTLDSLANDQDVVIGDLAITAAPFVGEIDFVKVTRASLEPDEFVSPVPTPSTILGDWTFDERPPGEYVTSGADKVLDASGNARHLTLLGLPRATHAAGDPVRGSTSALVLRNAEPDQLAYIDRGDAHLDFTASDSFTLEAVLKTTQTDTGGIVSKDKPGSGAGWAWQIEGGGSIRLSVSDGVYNSSVRSSVLDSISDGAWHHIAAVRDAATGELRLYKDYLQIDVGFDFTGGSLANDKDLLIGALHGTNAGFQGTIDRVRITGEALDPTMFIPCSVVAGDLNCDGLCDVADLDTLGACMNGPDIEVPPPGCTAIEFGRADLSEDGDVDLSDAAMLMRLLPGP